MEGILNEFDSPKEIQKIIKVVGVGGGGSNAVNHMYNEGIKDVNFVVCNTDIQALSKSPVPKKLLLGKGKGIENEGLGAGGKPERARIAAEASEDEIRALFSDGTKMAFITAGMGGGTGTGAAPVIAAIAREMNILTVGIVTIPFAFEMRPKIRQALEGVARMSSCVDALLVINNEKLCEIYPDIDIPNAFEIADSVVTQAAKGIAEIITVNGYINVDFADVNTIMRNGGVAIMNTGVGEGEHRITKAIEDALNSPLLNNNDVHNSKKVLLNLYCSEENKIMMAEMGELREFMEKMRNENIEVIWGITYEKNLGNKVKITILATGQGLDMIPKELLDKDLEKKFAEIKAAEKDTEEHNIEREKAADKWAGTLYSDLKESDNNTTIDMNDLLDNIDKVKEMAKKPAYERNK